MEFNNRGLKPVNVPNTMKCLKGHVMELIDTNPYADEGIKEVTCDKCEKPIAVSGGFYHCKICGDDKEGILPCDYHYSCAA
jgi:hypothetical protein